MTATARVALRDSHAGALLTVFAAALVTCDGRGRSRGGDSAERAAQAALDRHDAAAAECASPSGGGHADIQREVAYAEAPHQPAIVRFVNRRRPHTYCLAIPHENEQTGFEVAIEFIARHGGTIVRVEQNGRRNVDFGNAGRKSAADPNRIATRAGVRRTLAMLNADLGEGPIPAELFDRVAGFGQRFVAAIDSCLARADYRAVIAPHNNRDATLDADYGILSYGRPGAAAGDADKTVTGNPAIHESQDTDDFFVVTDRRDFDRLRADWNAALLSRDATDDGSLAIYYLDKRYINVEAQHGAHARQAAMLRAAAHLN